MYGLIGLDRNVPYLDQDLTSTKMNGTKLSLYRLQDHSLDLNISYHAEVSAMLDREKRRIEYTEGNPQLLSSTKDHRLSIAIACNSSL